MTFWKHFKQNYLGTSLWMLGLLLISLFTIHEPIVSWVVPLFFTLIILVLMVGNYFSWKKKFKK